MVKLFLRLLEPVFDDKKEAAKSFFGAFINGLYFDILPILCLPLLITYVQNGDLKNIYQISILFTIGVVLSFMVRVLCRGWYWYSQRKFMANLELKYRKKILLKENIYFEKTGTGKIQSIIDHGLATWSRTANDTLWYICRISTTLVLGVYVISLVDKWLLLMFFILVIFSVAVNFYFRAIKYKFDLQQKEVRNTFSALSVRSIMSRNEILYSDKFATESKKLHELKMEEYRLGVKSDIYGAFSVVPAEVIFLIMPFMGVSAFVYFIDSSLTAEKIALLISFIYFSSKMSSMVWQFIAFVYILVENFPDMKKLWEFIDNVPEMKNYDDGKKFVHGGGEVEMENIKFKYDEKEGASVLENFNLKIAAGEKLALVGHSGSGKTTIAKLISGYMQPTGGAVKIDGQDLSKLALKTYYKYLGYLTQEPMVFDGTIKENMLYALSDEDIKLAKKEKRNLDEEIKHSLGKAQCDFVFNMKKGIETEIGEKGIRLSGGERQRLAIAKLFLKNPEIIILDEPTSALDSFSEDKISKALEELFKGRTTIIIAHRLQTVKKADRILVIENGKIVEEGTHTDLVNRNGIYNDMLNMQSGF